MKQFHSVGKQMWGGKLCISAKFWHQDVRVSLRHKGFRNFCKQSGKLPDFNLTLLHNWTSKTWFCPRFGVQSLELKAWTPRPFCTEFRTELVPNPICALAGKCSKEGMVVSRNCYCSSKTIKVKWVCMYVCDENCPSIHPSIHPSMMVMMVMTFT